MKEDFDSSKDNNAKGLVWHYGKLIEQLAVEEY